MQEVNNALKMQFLECKVLEIYPETDIRVLAKRHIHIWVHKEIKGLFRKEYFKKKKHIYLIL